MRIKELSVAILLATLSFSTLADQKTLDAIISAGVVLAPAEQQALKEAKAEKIAEAIGKIVAAKAAKNDLDSIIKIVKAAIKSSPEYTVAITKAAVAAAPKYAGEIARAATEANPALAAAIAKAAKEAAPSKAAEIDNGVSEGQKTAGPDNNFRSSSSTPSSETNNADTNSLASPN